MLELLFALLAALMPPPKDMDKIPRITHPKICVSVTNYWPYDDSGEAVPFGGQADSDPFHTAYMVAIHSGMEGTFAAGPDGLGGRTVVLRGWGNIRFGPLPIWDRFGKPSYRRGVFWHDSYQRWVWALDIFTSQPIHYLECDWSFE